MRRERRDGDDQIHAVEQRAGELGLVILAAAWRAAAFARAIAEIAAAARIHRRHQLEARRVGDVRAGAGDGGLPALQRLAQGLQRGAGEFGPFIHEQHAAMGERDLAGAGAVAAARNRRRAGGMVRLAERRAGDEPPLLQHASDGMHHAHLQRLARREVRQQPGQARGEHRFAAAGRADHQQIMPAGGRHLERAAGGFHAAHIGEVGRRGPPPSCPAGGAGTSCVPRK